jgi:DNA recombination protein Rad52
MGFSQDQRQALSAKLDGKRVRERIQDGQSLSDIEGWFAIAEANRIFGFEGWDRETVALRCVWDGSRQGGYACVYLAQVRIRVRAGEAVVTREGHGSGSGSGLSPAEAHEGAAKEAETDATKRALVTFGNPFGLCLYDKERKGLRRVRTPKGPKPVSWPLPDANGETQSFGDPAAFCSALRHRISAAGDLAGLQRLWELNAPLLSELPHRLPDLRTERGEHYAEVLARLYRTRVLAFQKATSPAPHVMLPRRVRNKEHLRAVAKEPCLVCGRRPSQAHHLKYLQPRGLGVKPSDEFAVPLCRLHHRALHDAGDEEAWWHQQKVDPVTEAERLWRGRASG